MINRTMSNAGISQRRFFLPEREGKGAKVCVFQVRLLRDSAIFSREG